MPFDDSIIIDSAADGIRQEGHTFGLPDRGSSSCPPFVYTVNLPAAFTQQESWQDGSYDSMTEQEIVIYESIAG